MKIGMALGIQTASGAVDIPIGARILSVVDCFDALTSDRPYRPRLSNGDAIRILLERRGSMYDALVVDTFIRVHNELAVETLEAPTAPGGLSAITRVTSPQSILRRRPIPG